MYCIVMFIEFMFVIIGILFGSIVIVENVCNLVGFVLGGVIYFVIVFYYWGMVYLVLVGFMFIVLIFLL